MNTKIEKQSSFISELCKYYMDFLKVVFKSTRFPKRYIRLVNEKGFKVKDLDGKFIKAFDSHYNKIITFRKDRVGKSKEV